MTGTIVNILEDKGYFFVRDASGREYFAHKSALHLCRWDDVIYGRSVTFNVTNGPKGPRAEHVVIDTRGSLQRRIADAGDRHDWDECNRLEREK